MSRVKEAVLLDYLSYGLLMAFNQLSRLLPLALCCQLGRLFGLLLCLRPPEAHPSDQSVFRLRR